MSLGKITGEYMKFGIADFRGGGATGRNGMLEEGGDMVYGTRRYGDTWW